MILFNHGTYWSAGELRKLKAHMENEGSIRDISWTLKRKQSACDVMWRNIRRAELINSPFDNDTLVSIKQKEQHHDTF